jgi:hypothetical protein
MMAVAGDAMPLVDAELSSLLARFNAPVAELARELVRIVCDVRPDLDPRVRTGWGSVNFRHPRAGFVCAVFPLEDRVSLVFEHGRLLDNALLEGDTKQVRWIPLRPGGAIPIDDIAILLAEAIALRA